MQAQKLKKLNDRWKKSIERYRDSREHFFSYERGEILKKIDQKSTSTVKHIKENKERKMQFLTELNVKNQSSVMNIKKNSEISSLKDEDYRLTLQEKVGEKLKKFSKKNKEVLDGIKKEFEGKTNKSLQSFHKNYHEVVQFNEQKAVENIEKPIKKFENWVVDFNKVVRGAPEKGK
jgi:hypothetical protein